MLRPDDKDYKQDWEEMWADICTNKDGSLNLDAIQRELSDYRWMMSEVSDVYDDVTGGKASKPNTAAFEIIAIVNERFNEYADEAIEEYKADTEVIDLVATDKEPK
jgi:hypothetical protein